MARRTLEYRFRGRAIAASGTTVSGAVGDLAILWGSRPALVMHDWGAVRIELTIAGTSVAVDVTDPAVLDEMFRGNLAPLEEWLARHAGLTVEDVRSLLSRVEDVAASVDRIRPPSSPHFWRPDPDADPANFLATALDWASELAATMRTDQGPGPLSDELREAIERLLRIAEVKGVGISDLAKSTGIPASTLHDVKEAGASTALTPQVSVVVPAGVVRSLGRRKAGTRLTEAQKKAIVDAWKISGNAEDVHRQLGVPARTVRGIVAKEGVVPAKTRPREEILRIVRDEGISASEAGRRLGVPERTARQWVRAGSQAQAPGLAPVSTAPVSSGTTTQRGGLRDSLVTLVETEGISASEAGRRLGVPDRTARRWVSDSKK